MICDNVLVKDNIVKEFSTKKDPLCLDKYDDMNIELQVYSDRNCTKRVYPHFIDNLFITEEPKYCFGEEQILPFLKDLKKYLGINKNMHYYKIHFIFSTNVKAREYLEFETPIIMEDDIYNILLRMFINTFTVYEDKTIKDYYA